MCIHEGCKTRPNYNVEGETKALYCSNHKKEGMVDVINKTCKTCKTCLCYTQVKEKCDGYCLFCYMNMFPDKPVSRNYKTKEFSVVEYVKNEFPHFDWKTDKLQRLLNPLYLLMVMIVAFAAGAFVGIKYERNVSAKTLTKKAMESRDKEFVLKSKPNVASSDPLPHR